MCAVTPGEPASPGPGEWRAWIHRLLAAWAVFVALFFLVRFSFAFYFANQAAIEAFFSR